MINLTLYYSYFDQIQNKLQVDVKQRMNTLQSTLSPQLSMVEGQ